LQVCSACTNEVSDTALAVRGPIQQQEEPAWREGVAGKRCRVEVEGEVLVFACSKRRHVVKHANSRSPRVTFTGSGDRLRHAGREGDALWTCRNAAVEVVESGGERWSGEGSKRGGVVREVREVEWWGKWRGGVVENGKCEFVHESMFPNPYT